MESTTQHIDDTFDVDFQHRFALDERQEITWGLDCRYNNDSFDTQRQAGFATDRRKRNIYSVFAQDKIKLIEDRLALIIGSKFEQDDYTTFEYQPSGRLLWTPNPKNTVWGAISRAVRTPSRVDSDLWCDTGIQPSAFRMIVEGNDDFKPEEVLSYELGYRVQPTDNFFVDLAGFYNVFDNLKTLEVTNSFEMIPSPYMLMDLLYDNKMNGEVYGLEASANWNVTKTWKLAGSYSFLQMQLHRDNSSTCIGMSDDKSTENSSPHHQANLRSYWNLLDNVELDTALYYVDSLHSMDIPAYLRADARLGWHITEQLELSAVVRNLFDHRHPEFNHMLADEGEIARSFFVKMTYRF
jgi:iron complex outermembrane receptor protein